MKILLVRVAASTRYMQAMYEVVSTSAGRCAATTT